MRDEKSKYKTLTRRALILGSAKGALISCLIGRFYYLQILNSNIYQTLSNKNRLRILPTAPLRGDILDINGEILASNIRIYSLIVKIEFKSQLKYIVDKINNILINQNISLQRIVEKSKNTPISQPIKLIENISLQNAILVDSNLNLQEVKIIEEYIRNYKLSEKTFHVIGYIGSATLKEIDLENLPKNYKFLTGKDGIEKEYNKILQGKPGIKKIEVDAKGNFTKQVDVIPPVKGATIPLSIDKNVQNIISNHIGEYNGAIIISDLVKKKIIGMASMPTVDPNIFIDGVSSKEWKEIVSNKYNPLTNKCISSQYHPGSIFKIVMFFIYLKERN